MDFKCFVFLHRCTFPLILFLMGIIACPAQQVILNSGDTSHAGGQKHRSALVPEFYMANDLHDKDTTYEVKYYDKDDTTLYHWTDFDEVRFVSVFKSYTDSAHTYRDADGRNQPLPVSFIVYRYDRVGDNKWLYINYKTHQYLNLTEHRDQIVKTDTLTGNGEILVYKYYKVSEE